MHLSTDIWVWIAALLTLCIYSFLYKDNPFYKFAEHLFVGVSVGYTIAILFWSSFVPKIWNPLITDFANQWHLLLAMLLGTLFFSRFIPKVSWLIRWPIAIILGFAAGATIPVVIHAQLYEQIRFTMVPFLNVGPKEIIASSLIIIGVLSTLIYFFFSLKHTGIVGGIAKTGVIFLMVGFGASFGNTVMARISLLIGRMGFLLSNWLGLPIAQ